MNESKDNIEESNQPETDPDVISLPRRTFGTPQIFALFLFLLALTMMATALQVWEIYTRNRYAIVKRNFSGVVNDFERQIEKCNENIELWERHLESATSNLSDDERLNLKRKIKLAKAEILQQETENKDYFAAKKIRTEQWERKMEAIQARYRRSVIDAGISIGIFLIGALGLIYGAIALAFSIGSGKSWTRVNIYLLPFTVTTAACFFLSAKGRNIGFGVFEFFIIAIPFTIILARVNEWIAPIRDASLEGRDKFNRKYISRACSAILISLTVFHLLGYLPLRDLLREYLVDYLGKKIFSNKQEILMFLPVMLIIPATILFFKRMQPRLIYGLLQGLLILDILVLAFYIFVIARQFNRNGWSDKEIFQAILTASLTALVMYPLIAIIVMLRRPLGKELFQPVGDIREAKPTAINS